jgi:sugar-specific transcriptional regulator TrmB
MPRQRTPRPVAPPAVQALEALGLTPNEARAWVTLLEDEEGTGLTGYEVAARSGIPRSAVYTVLRQLESRGAVFPRGEEPVVFVPIDPARFLAEQQKATDGRFSAAREALARLGRRERPEPVWTLSRYDEVLARAARSLAGARRTVWLSAWPREVEALLPALDGLPAGVGHRVLHSPARLGTPPAGFAVYADSAEQDAQRARWAHKVVLVVDRREALIGGAEPGVDNHAVWTTNPSIVDLATNHIILDLTLMGRARGEDIGGLVAPMRRPVVGEEA